MITAVLITLVFILAVYLILMRRNIRKLVKDLNNINHRNTNQQLLLDTPNINLEQLLVEINKLLESKQAEKIAYMRKDTSFRKQISNISHDLRTPLTSILGYVQLIKNELDMDDNKEIKHDSLTVDTIKEYLDTVERKSLNLKQLIGGFYDLSRLESGEYEFHMERISIPVMLSQVMADFYDEFSQAGFSITTEIQEHISDVNADPQMVSRIYQNLFQNILKHGISSVKVSLTEEKNHIITRISNDTLPLDGEDVKHLFDRFFTVDHMRTGQNTGLGLAIVKNLVEQMGHEVSAEYNDEILSIVIIWKFGIY